MRKCNLPYRPRLRMLEERNAPGNLLGGVMEWSLGLAVAVEQADWTPEASDGFESAEGLPQARRVRLVAPESAGGEAVFNLSLPAPILPGGRKAEPGVAFEASSSLGGAAGDDGVLVPQGFATSGDGADSLLASLLAESDTIASVAPAVWPSPGSSANSEGGVGPLDLGILDPPLASSPSFGGDGLGNLSGPPVAQDNELYSLFMASDGYLPGWTDADPSTFVHRTVATQPSTGSLGESGPQVVTQGPDPGTP